MEIEKYLSSWASRARKATAEAHLILSRHERAKSRVILLSDSISKLQTLPIDVQGYFREALECLEHDLRRAANIMAWAGFFAVFSDKLYVGNEAAIRAIRPNWKFKSLVELKELVAEAQIIDVAKEVGFISNPEKRMLHGQLSTRNQCAHPTGYDPTMNSALGYVDDLISRTKTYL